MHPKHLAPRTSHLAPRASTRSRELVAASPRATAISAGSEITAILRVPEPGRLDLDRMVLFAVNPAADTSQYTQIDLLDRLLVRKIRVRNIDDLIRGRDPVYAPGGVFSALRQQTPIALGCFDLAGQDTLEVTARLFDDTDIGTWSLSVAAPFRPTRLRKDPGFCCDPDAPHAYLGSGLTKFSGGTATLRLTADEAGIVDLDSLQLACGGDRYVADYAAAQTAAVVVRSITLPSGEQLVVGTPRESPSIVNAPAAMWSHVGRRSAWAHFGQFEIGEDESIEIFVERLTSSPAAAAIAAGARFYSIHDLAHAATDEE